MMSRVVALITDHGDMLVGIFPQYWRVDCPFFSDELKLYDTEFSDNLINIYSEFAYSKVTVDYIITA